MHYLMFIVHDPEASEADAAAAPSIGAWFKDVRERGDYAMGIRLEDADAARTLRVRDGKELLTDGPFAETKEHIAGVALLECDSLEEALELARRNPAAHYGRVEVRPVHSFGGPILGADEQGVSREQRKGRPEPGNS